MYILSGASDIIMHKFRFWRSLKLRLFILIFIVGLIPSLIIYQSILKGYEDRAVKVRTLDVQNQLTVLADHLITYNYLIDPSSDVVNAELNLLSNLYSGRVMVINNRLKIVRDLAPFGNTRKSRNIKHIILGEASVNKKYRLLVGADLLGCQ